MPLTQTQLDIIDELLNGETEEGEPDNLNSRINNLVSAKEDVRALVRLHENLPDNVATSVLSTIRQRAKDAAQSIVDLLP